jgi:adenylylsulfate kinase-like enzyme
MNSSTGTNNEAAAAMSIPGEKRLNKMDCVRRTWSEIQLALAREESLTSIHSRLLGTGIPVDYHTFATYVNRLQKADKPRLVEKLTVANDSSAHPTRIPVQLNLEISVNADVERNDSDRKLTEWAQAAEINKDSGASQPEVSCKPSVHLFLQGTGGIGKSVMASILAQYLVVRGPNAKFIDADPVNRTLSRYKALGVERFELTDHGIVNPKRLEALVNRIVNADNHLVVDCGASTFLALQNHFQKAKMFRRLTSAGRNVYFHTVITAGQAQDDTLERFRELTVDTVPHRKIVVWLNEYFGRIEYDEKPFIETALYQNGKDRMAALITFRRQSPDTFGHDMDVMICRKQTFDEAIETEGSHSTMRKHRLGMVQRELFDQLDRSLLTTNNPINDNENHQDRISALTDRSMTNC